MTNSVIDLSTSNAANAPNRLSLRIAVPTDGEKSKRQISRPSSVM